MYLNIILVFFSVKPKLIDFMLKGERKLCKPIRTLISSYRDTTAESKPMSRCFLLTHLHKKH